MSRTPRKSLRALAALAALLVAGAVALPSAHDIPADVTVHVFIKPEGSMAHLLIRVPLASMLDVDWPMRSPEQLDLERIEPFLREGSTLWLSDNIDFYEGGTKLPYPALMGVRAAMPSDRSFASYDEALAHIKAPSLTNDTVMYRNQGFLDAWFDYPIESAASQFSIHAKLDRLGVRTVTVLHYVLPDGSVRAFEYQGDAGTVRLDPSAVQTGQIFAAMGFRHILSNTDHLLFLVCLAIPFRRLRSLLAAVGAYALGHSITLLASAAGMAPTPNWFPPLIETLIGASVLYLAIENLAVEHPRGRWKTAFAFGLAHGFGFSFVLRQGLQFAGSHVLTSTLAFNAGVELGLLAVLVAAVPALDLLFRYVAPGRTGPIILSALIGHTAWHWTADRWDILRQFPIAMPVIDAAFLAMVLRWAMLAVALGGAAWLLQVIRKAGADKQPVEAD